MSKRSQKIAFATALLVMTLTACAPVSEAARPVTTEEAQLLAVTRFNNFDAGTRGVMSSIRDAATDLAIDGWVDFETGIGYAVLTADGSQHSQLLWDAATLAARPITSNEADQLREVPISTPATLDGFGTTALSSDGGLHTLLAILIALGNDRPDNPLLLQQGGALWLRTDYVGDVPVTVFSGPTDASDTSAPNQTVDPDAANARYWVDEEGLLQRFEVRLGLDWVTVDFEKASDVNLTNPFVTTQ